MPITELQKLQGTDKATPQEKMEALRKLEKNPPINSTVAHPLQHLVEAEQKAAEEEEKESAKHEHEDKAKHEDKKMTKG